MNFAAIKARVAALAGVKHERRVFGHASGWKEPMDTCVCGAKWPCPLVDSYAIAVADRAELVKLIEELAIAGRALDEAPHTTAELWQAFRAALAKVQS